MKPTDKPAFVLQLIGLAAIKPGAKLTTESYEIWFNALHHWTLDDFKAAAAHLATSMEFMPSPFHFEQLRKAGRPTAEEAWKVARGTARRYRENQPAPQSSDSFLDHVIRTALGGYRALAMCNSDYIDVRFRQFKEAYESLQDVEDTRSALPQLTHGDQRVKHLKGPAAIDDNPKWLQT